MTSRLSFVRFGTYAILLIAAFTAVRQNYVIPVQLPRVLGPDRVEWFGASDSRLTSPHLDRGPDFGHTVLSGSAVLRIANERIAQESIALQELADATFRLELQERRLKWRVTRAVKKALGDGTIWITVLVDDQTGSAKLERKRHPEF